jgi:hypothetical protein
VEQLSAEPRKTLVVDLDLDEVGRSKPERRDATVYLSLNKGVWWVLLDTSGYTSKLRETTLNQSALSAYEDDIVAEAEQIAKHPVWKTLDQNLKPAAGSEESLDVCMKETMTIGSKLYEGLREDDVLAEVLRLINALPNRSKIQFMMEKVAFPWELLYPEHYDQGQDDAVHDPDLFWGSRFEIECLLFSDSEADKLPEQRRQSGKLSVSIAVNTAIDSEWKRQRGPFLPVEFHESYCAASLGDRGNVLKVYADIRKMVTTAYPGSLIYFFCHGSVKKLQFGGARDSITPHSVSEKIAYPGWPIVFVNACSAGDISPLSFISFRTKFRKKRAAGLIAPSFPVPALFAAGFGKRVLERYARASRSAVLYETFVKTC